MPSTNSWQSGISGNWTIAADWSAGVVPIAGDTALIAAGGTYTVTISSAVAVDSLSLNAGGATVKDSGTLALGGTLSLIAGTFDLAGTIDGGTIVDSGSNLVTQGGTLSGVAYDAAALNVSGNNFGVDLTIADGSTVDNAAGNGPGTINVTAFYGELSVVNSQSLSGVTINDNTFNGGVVINTPTVTGVTVNLSTGYISLLSFTGDTTFDNGTINGSTIAASDNYIYNSGTQSVLTLGPNAIVNLNQSGLFGDSNAGDGVVNQGLIAAGLAGGTADISPYSFTNTGSVEVSNGETVDAGFGTLYFGVFGGGALPEPVTGGFTNAASGSISVSGTGSVLLLGGNDFANAGSITIANGGSVYIEPSTSAGVAQPGGFYNVGAGSRLELGEPAAGTITFTSGDMSDLALDAPADFDGTLNGLANGVVLDFLNTAVTGATLSGDTLFVNAGSTQYSYGLTAPLPDSTVLTTKDAAGTGIDVVVSPIGYALAIAQVNTASPIELGEVHVGGTPSATISVTNAASAPAESLDATIAATGAATASGSFNLLAAGQTDASDLTVGLSAAAAGIQSGSVILSFESDGTGTDGDSPVILSNQTFAVTGTAYRIAGGFIGAPGVIYLHTGDTTSESITINNTVAADGFSESVLGTFIGVTGALAGGSGTVVVAPSSAGTLTAAVSAAAPGTYTGDIVFNAQSDGEGVDTLGITELGTIHVPLSYDVDNHATVLPVLGSGAGTLTPGFTANTYTLNLGVTTRYAGALSDGLEIMNAALGPAADSLSLSFDVTGDSEYTNGGTGAVSGIMFGDSDGNPTVSLNTSLVGTFNETIVVNGTGGNPSGYSQTLTAQTIDVTGTILPVPEVVVGAVTAPANALAGQIVPITWTLSNEGDAPAGGPWSDEVFVASDAAGDNPQPLGTFLFEGAIAVGQTVTRQESVTLPIGLSGDEWIDVRTDQSDQLAEPLSDAQKQTVASQPTSVTQPPAPNLVVSNISAPTGGFSGQRTTISWTVTNTGGAGTSGASWHDNIYLSLSPTLEASGTRFDTVANTSVLLASVTNPTYLAAGQSYTNTATVTLPQGIDGAYYIIVGADAGGQVFQDPTGPAGYSASSVFSVQASPVPDLVVTSVQAAPNAFSGQPFAITWTVENTGSVIAATTPWTDAILMSLDGSLDANSVLLTTTNHNDPLAPGASYTHTATVTLPVGAGGDATFFVVADAGDVVYEGALHANDAGATPGTTNIAITPPPELVASLINVPATVVAGHSLSFSYQVANEGATTTPNTSWTDSVYLSTDATLNNSATLISSSTHYGALAAGQSYTVSSSATLSGDLSGSWYLIVRSDSADQVFELDRSGDVAVSAAISVANAPPGLTVSSVTAPAGGEAGHQVAIAWRVTNNGIGDTAAATWSDNIVLSASGVFGASDNITLASVTAPPGPLAAGGSYDQSANVSLPLTLTGDYTLFVVTDSDPLVPETNLTMAASSGQAFSVTRQLPDLQVSPVTGPPVATAGDTVTINWTVDNAGNAATDATYWYDNVYVSTSPGAVGTLLGQVRHVNPLDAGGSYNAGASFVLPAGLATGTYYFVVAADADGQVTEVSHGDDLGSSVAATLTGVAPGTNTPPQVAVSDVTAPPGAVSGQNFTVSYTIGNSGGATPNGWYDSVYLSRNQILGGNSDIYLGSVHNTGLTAGASQTNTQTFTVPDGQSGPFWVIVVADAGDALSTDRNGDNSFAVSTEIQVGLPPAADLSVGTITVPSAGISGDNVSVTYTVNNLSASAEQGTWDDALYLSSNGTWNASDPLIGEVQVTGGVSAGGSYTETLTAPVPGVAPGNYYVIVRTDVKQETAGTNATGVSSGTVSVAIPTLTPGTPAAGMLTQGGAAYYQFTVASGQTVNLSLTSSNPVSINNIYVGYNELPTVEQYDVTSVNPAVADPSAVIAVSQPGTYYVMVAGDSVNGTENYTLNAQVAAFSISGITPDYGSNLGSVTLTIDGAQFNAGEQVEVIAPDGTVRDATTVQWVNSTEVWATFNLEGLAVGTYDVEIADGVRNASLPNAFQVTNGPTGQASVSLVLPQEIGPNEKDFVQVDYINTGQTDIESPIIEINSAQALLQSEPGAAGANTIDFLGTNANGPTGILPPGAEGTATFSYTPIDPQGDELLTFSAAAAAPDGSNTTSPPIDWSSIESVSRPPTVDPTDWSNVWGDFIGLVGTTTASLNSALAQAATELGEVGQPTNDVATLLQFILFQASGAMTGGYQADTTDIQANSSSLSLSLQRYYDGTLLGRDATGEFGDGWTSNFDVSAVTDASGDVYIQSPGVLHIFTLQANGLYTAGAGDPATLTVSSGLYQMNDGSGDIEAFLADGKLGSVTGANGNIVDLTYNNSGVLQQAASETTGETITFTSNAQGLITGATDSDGQQVSYTYNAAGTQLSSVSGPAGVTNYAYVAPTGSVQDNALTSITNPDGTQDTFTYNSQGWLASQSGSGDPVTYSYNRSGEVTVTNALGDPTTMLYGSNGQVARIEDALGDATQLQYNADGQVSGIVSPGGDIANYSYDPLSNLTAAIDPLGGTVSGAYTPGTENLTGLTNQLGSQTQYTYDAAGDVTGIIYQDDSGNTYDYSTEGLLTSSTDADGNTINYSYNGAGELTEEAFGNGTTDLYTYDGQGNLLTATGPGGTTTTYAYNAANQLTGMTDPAGQVESYTYNAGGQLTSVTDPNGSVTRYTYNAAGQISGLHDGAGNLLDQYTYDSAGQLIKTLTGNDASTTYLYDADGRTTEILNRNSDGGVASFDDYAYNANSQVTAEDTSDGNWTYSYDAEGELTNAVFVSTNAAIQNQTISYTYDAAGNRVSQTLNGVVTDYTTNALNEYTQVGGMTYTYDADGNMTSETNSSGTTNYTYNQSNQLIAQSGPGGTFQYTYDALGNLVAETENGLTTDYVNNPLSLSNATQSLDSIAQAWSNGTVTATYDYGLGLAAVANGAGDLSYVDTDSAGDVTGLVGPSGNLSNAYFYLPYGQATQISGSSEDPFQFAGGLGVTSDGSGLDFMRARYYDPTLGRFISEDPTGLAGGPNLYEYVGNDPANAVDPQGEGTVFVQGGIDAYYGPGGGVSTGAFLTTENDFGWFDFGITLSEAHGIGYSTPAASVVGGYDRRGTSGMAGPGKEVGYSAQLVSGSIILDNDGVPQGFTIGGETPAYGGHVAQTDSHVIPFIQTALNYYFNNFDYRQNDIFVPAAQKRLHFGLSGDPNDIVGPAGFGPENFVPASAPLDYTIDFQNEASASAPAHDVTVTTQLDPNLNWNTFRLTGFGFDNLTYTLAGNEPFYSAVLDLSATKGYDVDVTAGVNIATGLVTWTFDTIDPATGQTPTDPTIGFLPVNDANNDGDAYVSYSVQTNSAAVSGDVVTAQSTVTFDTQGPIDTQAVSDTLDAVAPTSDVQALPGQTTDPTFQVSWSGQDDADGSGIAYYTIYVSEDGGPATPWLTDTMLTNALFTGQTGHTYAFSSVATDNAGNVEAMHAAPDTVTQVGTMSVAPRDLVWTGAADTNVANVANWNDITNDVDPALSPPDPNDILEFLSNGETIAGTDSVAQLQFGGASQWTVGSGTGLNAGSGITVGEAGTAALLLDDGGSISGLGTTDVISGSVSAGATVTVDGIGSNWTSDGELIVAGLGTGELIVRNLGSVQIGSELTASPSPGLDIASGAGANGIVTVDGSSLSNTGEFVVGDAGTGKLTVEAGGTVMTSPGTTAGLAGLEISNTASSSGSEVDVTGAGSDLQVTGLLEVGVAGSGVLGVSGGATVTAGSFDSGNINSAVGQISVTDADLMVSGPATVADAGTGVLSVLSGATFSAAGLTIGANKGSSGAVVVSGAGSDLTISGNLNIGTALGAGDLTVGPSAAVHAAVINVAGQVVLEGGLLDPSVTVINPNKSLGGSGTVASGDIIDEGILQAGDGTPGQLELIQGTIVGGGTLMENGSKVANKANAVGVLQINTFGTMEVDGAVLNLPATTFANDVTPTTTYTVTHSVIDVNFEDSTGVLQLDDIAGFGGTIVTFQAGDQFIVTGGTLSGLGVNNGSTLTMADSGNSGTDQLIFASPVSASYFNIVNGNTVEVVACFAAGTRIETADGPVAVEALRIGDHVFTHDGASEPIVWIGSRAVNCRAHAVPETVWPVRISAWAFGPNVPVRDLYLSPDHAVFVKGVLVPVKLLVNGTSITQMERATVTYYHVELPEHAVILAEGLPVESYLDIGDRTNFGDGTVIRLFPDFATRFTANIAREWETRGVAPLVMAGVRLGAARKAVHAGSATSPLMRKTGS